MDLGARAQARRRDAAVEPQRGAPGARARRGRALGRRAVRRPASGVGQGALAAGGRAGRAGAARRGYRRSPCRSGRAARLGTDAGGAETAERCGGGEGTLARRRRRRVGEPDGRDARARVQQARPPRAGHPGAGRLDGGLLHRRRPLLREGGRAHGVQHGRALPLRRRHRRVPLQDDGGPRGQAVGDAQLQANVRREEASARQGPGAVVPAAWRGGDEAVRLLVRRSCGGRAAVTRRSHGVRVAFAHGERHMHVTRRCVCCGRRSDRRARVAAAGARCARSSSGARRAPEISS